MQNAHMRVQVLVKGRPITEFTHNGQTFIEGRPGSDFEIEVQNLTAARTMAVISVDGLSIMDGQPAGPESSGYLLNAYQTVRIPGWMLDQNQVAKFTFSSRKDSYAQQGKGNATNCGVIGVMLIAEKIKVPTQPLYRSYTAASKGIGGPFYGNVGGSLGGAVGGGFAGISQVVGDNVLQNSVTTSLTSTGLESAQLSATSNVSVNNLGTEFGAATQFATTQVEFDSGVTLSTIAMFYDDARGLKARGIVLERPSRMRYTTSTPNPFPAMGCKPPKGWSGQ